MFIRYTHAHKSLTPKYCCPVYSRCNDNYPLSVRRDNNKDSGVKFRRTTATAKHHHQQTWSTLYRIRTPSGTQFQPYEARLRKLDAPTDYIVTLMTFSSFSPLLRQTSNRRQQQHPSNTTMSNPDPPCICCNLRPPYHMYYDNKPFETTHWTHPPSAIIASAEKKRVRVLPICYRCHSLFRAGRVSGRYLQLCQPLGGMFSASLLYHQGGGWSAGLYAYRYIRRYARL